MKRLLAISLFFLPACAGNVPEQPVTATKEPASDKVCDVIREPTAPSETIFKNCVFTPDILDNAAK